MEKKWTKSEKMLLVVAVLSLSFLMTIMFVPLNGFTEIWDDGFSYIVRESGFEYLFFGAWDYTESVSALASAVTIASWVVSLILVAVIILACIKFSKNKNIIILSTIAVAFLFAVVYMIVGFVTTNEVTKFYDNPISEYYFPANAHTLSYFPVIVQFVLLGLGCLFFYMGKKEQVLTMESKDEVEATYKLDIKVGNNSNIASKVLLIVAIVSVTFFAAIVCVPLAKFAVTEDGAVSDTTSIYGFNALFGGLGSRFARSGIIAASVISWIVFSMFEVLLVMLILAVTVFRKKKAKKVILFTIIAVAMFFAIAYMIAGFVTADAVADFYESERHVRSISRDPYTGNWIYDYYYVSIRTKNVYTLAYFPAIIQTVCFALGLVALIKVVDNDPMKSAVKQTVVTSSNTPVVDDIKRFKELLDMGAITQEEYDAKKKELLGL